MSFRIVPFEDIDIVKWNSCVHYAANGNVFGYHWFLKNTIKEWDAIVYRDYEAVMAIPRHHRKHGKSDEIKTPEYLRELGLYGIGLLNSQKVEEAISMFPAEIPNIRIALNLGNPVRNLPEFNIQQVKNHTISLYDNYDKIRSGYTDEARQIEDLSSMGWWLDNQLKPEELIEFIFMKKQLDWDRYTALRIIYNALHRGIGVISSLRDQKKELIAAAFFIHSHGRIVHLFSSSYKRSSVDPKLYLIDGMIQTHAGKPLIFDLNMSENLITRSLGAESYEYPVLTKGGSKRNWWASLVDYFQ